MKRTVFLIAALALALSACADRRVGSFGPGSDEQTSPSPSESDEQQTLTYEVWFAGSEGWLFVLKRTARPEPGVGKIALESLLAGPSEAEREAGVGTAIPDGTELLGLDIDDGIATVDLSSQYEQGSGSHAEFLRLAQVVYTITQFETVQGVNFRIEGKPVEMFGGHGILLDGPRARRDYRDYLPPILVESPSIGERVDNPVSVSGTANVFEATVSLRILDAGGKEIARTFTTATCGTGCRGSYSVSVPYEVDREQPGVIEVFESSAEDGRPTHVVRIPVTLTP
ncbi:MAG: Gmad2 immunoglobulin-like domain-containing protein [Actinomycetota bacterium]